MDPTELVRKVDGALLRSVPVSTLARANITSLDQVEKKIWRLSQVRLHAWRYSSKTVSVTSALADFQIRPVRFICLTFPGVLPGEKVARSEAAGLQVRFTGQENYRQMAKSDE